MKRRNQPKTKWRRQKMRYLTIPAPITVLNPDTKKPMKGIQLEDGTLDPEKVWEPMSFKSFLVRHFLNRENFAVGYWGAKMVQFLEESVFEAEPGVVVPVADDVWTHISKTCEQINNVPAWLLRQYLPFFEAIMKAPDSKADVKADDKKASA